MLLLIAFHLLSLLIYLISAKPTGDTVNISADEKLNGTTTIKGLNFSRANPTTLEQDLRDYSIKCLVTPNHRKIPQALWKALAVDCRYILSEVMSQLSYIFDDLEFGNGQYRSPEGKVLPAMWVHDRCTVYVKSSFTDERAFMSLMEVVLTAHKVLETCVENGRHLLGGLGHVGSIVHFFHVGLLGPGLRQGSITGLGSNNSNDPDLDILKRSIDPTPLDLKLH